MLGSLHTHAQPTLFLMKLGAGMQMREADKGRSAKRKGRGNAADDAANEQDMSRKFYKKKY